MGCTGPQDLATAVAERVGGAAASAAAERNAPGLPAPVSRKHRPHAPTQRASPRRSERQARTARDGLDFIISQDENAPRSTEDIAF